VKITQFIRKNYVSVNPDISLKKIEEIMADRTISHILVFDKKSLIGIISDRDVKKYRSIFAETNVSKEMDEATLGFKAHQIMTHNPKTIYENSYAIDGINLMLKEHISCLPVINMDNDVIGIITSSDLLRWMARLIKFLEPDSS